MTPKNKAKELVNKYVVFCGMEMTEIQCALTAVDEILNLMIKDFKWDINNNGNIAYWQEVKTEIKLL